MAHIQPGGKKFHEVKPQECMPRSHSVAILNKVCDCFQRIGHLQYIRLPLVMSSAQSLYYRHITDLIWGFPHISVYFDDILVMENDDSAPFRNISPNLTRHRGRKRTLRTNASPVLTKNKLRGSYCLCRCFVRQHDVHLLLYKTTVRIFPAT